MPAPPSPAHKSFRAVVWFPLAFVAAFAVMFLTAFAAPSPRGLELGVVGSKGEVMDVRRAASQEFGDGVEVRGVTSQQEAERLVRRNEIAGAYVAGAEPKLLTASAASGIRANFLNEAVGQHLARDVSGTAAAKVDLRPAEKGDLSGAGLFFYALPLLLVGMITSIVLLQAVTWTPRRKAAAIAVTGAFGSVFVYAVAVARDVIPSNPLLIFYAFVLTQTIGWLTTAVALIFRHHFMPVAMTFVLILGIPTAGGTVPADMLPGALGVLHQFLPFGQFVDLVRATGYLEGQGWVRPLLTLFAWLLVSASLLLWAARRTSPAPARAGKTTPASAT